MAAGRFQTELPTMAQASRHVMDVNAGIQSELSRLISSLEPLFSTWQGVASVNFHSVKERWNANAQQLNTALAGIAQTMSTNEAAYSSSEETNASGFSRIGSSL